MSDDVPDLRRAVADYAEEIAGALERVLRHQLEGVWLSGSSALDDLQLTSDVDMAAVTATALSRDDAAAVVEAVERVECPLRGIELVITPLAEARAASGRFTLNVNTGRAMPGRVSMDPDDDPAHWFVLDLVIVREHGRVLRGPPARDVFGVVSADRVRAALLVSLAWHAEHEPAGANAVLNACRAWRWAVDGRLASKSDAAAWALGRGHAPVIEAATAIRGGQPGSLEPAQVRALLSAVEGALGPVRRA